MLLTGQTATIVGGNGQIARLLTPLLREKGWHVRSVIRDAEQSAGVEALGADPLIADIESMDARDLAPFFKGSALVIFAAGAGYGSGARRKRTVDFGGSLLSQRSALEAGARRFIQISALVADRLVDPESSHVWKEYVRAKQDADKALRETSLEWTIVRPGLLTDDEGTGRVLLEKRLPGLSVDSLTIPRADVAQVVAQCVDLPGTIGKSFDVVSGLTPIDQALRAL